MFIIAFLCEKSLEIASDLYNEKHETAERNLGCTTIPVLTSSRRREAQKRYWGSLSLAGRDHTLWVDIRGHHGAVTTDAAVRERRGRSLEGTSGTGAHTASVA